MESKCCLELLHPTGPWVLTCIDPEKNGIDTETFENLADADAFCAKWDGKRNLYWSVNPTKEPMNKKPRKEDVARVVWLHLDLDPRASEDIGDEQERIRNVVDAMEKKPTLTIFTGGGYQCFWALRDPIELDGTIECADDAARRNRWLENEYKADHCHNIDRIMRVPNTMNLPDARKRKRGRESVLSVLHDYGPDRVYDAAEFPEEASLTESAEHGDLDFANVPVNINLDAVNISNRLKVIAVHGREPEEPKDGDNSRSAWLYDFLCNALREGLDEASIYSIITDKRFKISESVIDKNSSADAYARRQIEKAIAIVGPFDSWNPATKQGTPVPNYNNARLAIQRLGITCEHDTFRDRLIIGGNPLQDLQGQMSDAAISMLRQLIIERFQFDPRTTNTRDAAVQLCNENRFDPVVNYLDQLTWDGEPRIGTWLQDYLCAPDTPYTRAVGRIVLLAAVRRARQPGCKFDTIIVLEGEQGTGKSTAVRILAGDDYFSDADILAGEAKTQMENIEGVWLYELGELEGMTRAEVNKVKAFASRQEDRARRAYARFRTDRPRRCVFIGTTNNDTYLRDRTGNRRFLPVRTGAINIDALKDDRDQLWAEAAELEGRGEQILLPQELWSDASQEQDQRLEHHPWEDTLAQIGRPHGTVGNQQPIHRQGDYERVRSSTILSILGFENAKDATPHHTKQIATLMRGLGWKGPKTLVFGKDDRAKGYQRPVTDR